jgi:hypothetical protein
MKMPFKMTFLRQDPPAKPGDKPPDPVELKGGEKRLTPRCQLLIGVEGWAVDPPLAGVTRSVLVLLIDEKNNHSQDDAIYATPTKDAKQWAASINLRHLTCPHTYRIVVIVRERNGGTAVSTGAAVVVGCTTPE